MNAPAPPKPSLALLVVDDDADLREALSGLLEVEGHAVSGASHGRAALDHLSAADRPCAILLDWSMPVMGGREFLSERERSPALRDVPVFVVSGSHRPIGDDRVSGWLMKPCDGASVVALLDDVCARHCRCAECPRPPAAR